jgi:branched-chain amino acid transport system permease protein
MDQLLQILILGLSLGGVYALMSSGLTLIFGVMRIVNLSHAAFIVVAAYISYWAFKLIGLDPILSMFITFPVMFLVGIIVYKLLFAKVIENSRFVEITVLITFALSLIIEGLLNYFFTGIYRSTTPSYCTDCFYLGSLYFPKSQLYATGISVLILLGLFLFLRLTSLGNAIRATTQNRTAAKTVGVNVDRISMLTFGIGTALAGASGSLVSFLFTFYPAKHMDWGTIILALIVLGGMGSLFGSLVGSFVLSITAAFVSYHFGPTWSPITFYSALFIILLFRPQGLFGKKMELS